MDLGSGSTSRHVITIPPSGSRILRSRSISPTTVVGWALATSSVPIQAIASYRQSVSGVVKQEISAQPTLPKLLYKSPANRSLGVAIANPYVDVSISMKLQFNDSEGRKLGDSVRVTVPAAGHTAFVLGERFPNLGNISGVLTIAATDGARDNFVAWTLAADEVGIFSTMPPGAYSWPVSHWDRIWLVYLDVANAAVKNGYLSSIPELRIHSEPEVNAYAREGATVGIYLALSQLIRSWLPIQQSRPSSR
jgi:hypothetical protein